MMNAEGSMPTNPEHEPRHGSANTFLGPIQGNVNPVQYADQAAEHGGAGAESLSVGALKNGPEIQARPALGRHQAEWQPSAYSTMPKPHVPKHRASEEPQAEHREPTSEQNTDEGHGTVDDATPETGPARGRGRGRGRVPLPWRRSFGIGLSLSLLLGGCGTTSAEETPAKIIGESITSSAIEQVLSVEPSTESTMLFEHDLEQGGCATDIPEAARNAATIFDRINHAAQTYSRMPPEKLEQAAGIVMDNLGEARQTYQRIPLPDDPNDGYRALEAALTDQPDRPIDDYKDMLATMLAPYGVTVKYSWDVNSLTGYEIGTPISQRITPLTEADNDTNANLKGVIIGIAEASHRFTPNQLRVLNIKTIYVGDVRHTTALNNQGEEAPALSRVEADGTRVIEIDALESGSYSAIFTIGHEFAGHGVVAAVCHGSYSAAALDASFPAGYRPNPSIASFFASHDPEWSFDGTGGSAVTYELPDGTHVTTFEELESPGLTVPEGTRVVAFDAYGTASSEETPATTLDAIYEPGMTERFFAHPATLEDSTPLKQVAILLGGMERLGLKDEVGYQVLQLQAAALKAELVRRSDDLDAGYVAFEAAYGGSHNVTDIGDVPFPDNLIAEHQMSERLGDLATRIGDALQQAVSTEEPHK